jgi:hypothetical protein
VTEACTFHSVHVWPGQQHCCLLGDDCEPVNVWFELPSTLSHGLHTFRAFAFGTEQQAEIWYPDNERRLIYYKP